MLQEQEVVEIREPVVRCYFALDGPRYYVHERGGCHLEAFESLASQLGPVEMSGPLYPLWSRDSSVWWRDFSQLELAHRELSTARQQELLALQDGEYMRVLVRIRPLPGEDPFMRVFYLALIFHRIGDFFKMGTCRFDESETASQRISATTQFANLAKVIHVPREPFLAELAEAVEEEAALIEEAIEIDSCKVSEGRWEVWLESPHPFIRESMLSNLRTPDEVVAELAKDPLLQHALLSRLELPREAFLPILEDPSRWSDRARRHRSMPEEFLEVMGRAYNI